MIEDVMNSYNILKQEVIKMLSNPQHDLEEPLFARGNKLYSRNELIKEIENDQEVGLGILNKLILLAIDLVSRKREKLEP